MRCPIWFAPRRVALWLSALALAALFAGCGVSFGAGSEETEIFKRLTVEGPFTPKSLLSVTLEYEQPYTVPVEVACNILREGSGRRPAPTPFVRIPPNPEPNGGPVEEATPTAGSVTRPMQAPGRPGRYLLWCFTTEDRNNGIVERFRIVPGPTPAPERARPPDAGWSAFLRSSSRVKLYLT